MQLMLFFQLMKIVLSSRGMHDEKEELLRFASSGGHFIHGMVVIFRVRPVESFTPRKTTPYLIKYGGQSPFFLPVYVFVFCVDGCALC